uniref:Uncharacterized protein n=1 Tax=Hanusia phi TaxID=3032 RepID=A0A7S0HH30_9CRYP
MNTVLVGAPLKTVGSGSQSGMAFVYQKDKGGLDNWGLVSSFSLENTSYIVEGYEHFGTSVAISGRYLVIGCPQCNGRNVREWSAGMAFLFRCSSVDPSTHQCDAWELLKELVPEPDGTTGPFWCASPLSTTGKAGDWTCHRDMDNFGNSVSILGCCNDLGELAWPDGLSARADPVTGYSWCNLIDPCSHAVVAVGAYMDSTAGILGEGYDSHRHGSVYLYSNRAGDDTFPQTKNLSSSGRNESDFVGQSQKVSAMDEIEDTMFGRHVFLGPCYNSSGELSVCLTVSRSSCINRKCYTPLSPATGISICYCDYSEHGWSDEIYLFARHSGGYDSWGLQDKYCDVFIACPPAPNCTELYATANLRAKYEVLQTHLGPGLSSSEIPANPNGDATRTDYACPGADASGAINPGPCLGVQCVPRAMQMRDAFFGSAVQVLGSKALIGLPSWESQGAAFIVRRELVSEQVVFDFAWTPWTCDTNQL